MGGWRPEALPDYADATDAIAAHESFEATYRIRTKNGATRHVWERGRGVYDPTEALLAIEGFITDVTSYRERELQGE